MNFKFNFWKLITVVSGWLYVVQEKDERECAQHREAQENWAQQVHLMF